jgi:hypothetical protein
MPFVVGERYDRQHIHDELGGELDTYLPQKDGQIVCGCFRPDDNPRVPDEILVGSGPAIKRKAAVFLLQRWYVPIFIKRDTNDWEYMGDYRVRGVSDNRPVIERKQREAGRTDVTRILYLERLHS